MNLASRVLGQSARRLCDDMRKVHGHPVLLAYTFVDRSRLLLTVRPCAPASAPEPQADQGLAPRAGSAADAVGACTRLDAMPPGADGSPRAGCVSERGRGGVCKSSMSGSSNNSQSACCVDKRVRAQPARRPVRMPCRGSRGLPGMRRHTSSRPHKSITNLQGFLITHKAHVRENRPRGRRECDAVRRKRSRGSAVPAGCCRWRARRWATSRDWRRTSPRPSCRGLIEAGAMFPNRHCGAFRGRPGPRACAFR